MASETPPFWWKESGFAALALKPAEWVYSFFACRNLDRRIPPQIDLPVLCIGNFTLGGAGKTPVAISFAKAAKEMGFKPGIVSRGFGGTTRGQHRVDPDHDRARDVGDEPLLLARHAMVMVGADRHASAVKLKEAGCDLILMDDGFQSRRLYTDYALLVVDATRGLGNGRVFPAGPLRAPLPNQLAYADGVLVIGQGDGGDRAIRLASRAAKPVFLGSLVSSASHKVDKKRFLAFAGIGNPQKFFKSVRDMGGEIDQTRIFADHHFFSEFDLKDIADSAETHKLWLATTAKDYVRLVTDKLDDKLKRLVVFDVDVAFEDAGYCQRILRDVIRNYKERMIGQ